MAPVNHYVNPGYFCRTQKMLYLYFFGDAGREMSCRQVFPGQVTNALLRYSLHISVTAHFGTLGIKLMSNGCPFGKDTDVTVDFFIGICLYRWTTQNESQWSWAWWWEVFLYLIPLFLSSSELKLGGDTFTPLFSLPFLFWVQNDLWFELYFGETWAGLGSRGTEDFKRIKQEFFRFAAVNGAQTYVCLSEMHNVISPSSCGLCCPEDSYWGWEVPGSSLAKRRHSHLALFKSPTSLRSAFLQVIISQAKPWQLFWLKF